MDLNLAVAEPLRHDAERLRASAREVLSGPAYGRGDEGPLTDVLLRARTWLARALDGLFGALLGNRGLAWLVVALATAAVVLLVLRWGRQVRSEATPEATTGDLSSLRDARYWQTEASRHAADGAWRDAVRAAYLALAADIVRRGGVADARGLTVGEIDRLARGTDPDQAAAIATAGRVFEDTHYGRRPADEAGYRQVAAALDARFAGRP